MQKLILVVNSDHSRFKKYPRLSFWKSPSKVDHFGVFESKSGDNGPSIVGVCRENDTIAEDEKGIFFHEYTVKEEDSKGIGSLQIVSSKVNVIPSWYAPTVTCLWLPYSFKERPSGDECVLIGTSEKQLLCISATGEIKRTLRLDQVPLRM
jgi:hypothetical protein